MGNKTTYGGGDDPLVNDMYDIFEVGKRVTEYSESLEDEKKFDFTVDVSGNIENLKNYGLLPLRNLQMIFLFLQHWDLFNIFQTCKVFYCVSNSNLFWKDYFACCFTVPNKKRIEDININWKRIFYIEMRPTRQNKFYKDIFNRPLRKEGMELYEDFDILQKIVITGLHGAGKSQLLMRFSENTFSEIHISHIGVDFKIKKMSLESNNKILKLQVWDSYRETRFRTLQPSFLKGAHAVIICFSMEDNGNENLEEKLIHNLENIKSQVSSGYEENIIFCGCKSDLGERFSRSEMKKKIKSVLSVACDGYFKKLIEEDEEKFFLNSYCECSAKESINCTLPIGLCITKFFQNTVFV